MISNDIIKLAYGIPGIWDPADPHSPSIEDLEDFAAFIIEAEREACAKIAESYEPTCDRCPSGVAAAIRARGQNK
jgi:hypothetical protein